MPTIATMQPIKSFHQIVEMVINAPVHDLIGGAIGFFIMIAIMKNRK